MEAGDLGTKKFDGGILLTPSDDILLSFLVDMSTVLEFQYSLSHALFFTSLFSYSWSFQGLNCVHGVFL
jgi:hypothetical protein